MEGSISLCIGFLYRKSCQQIAATSNAEAYRATNICHTSPALKYLLQLRCQCKGFYLRIHHRIWQCFQIFVVQDRIFVVQNSRGGSKTNICCHHIFLGYQKLIVAKQKGFWFPVTHCKINMVVAYCTEKRVGLLILSLLQRKIRYEAEITHKHM